MPVSTELRTAIIQHGVDTGKSQAEIAKDLQDADMQQASQEAHSAEASGEARIAQQSPLTKIPAINTFTEGISKLMKAGAVPAGLATEAVMKGPGAVGKEFSKERMNKAITEGMPTYRQYSEQPGYKAPNFLAQGVQNAFQGSPEMLKPVLDTALTVGTDPTALAMDLGAGVFSKLAPKLSSKIPNAVKAVGRALNPYGEAADLISKGVYKAPQYGLDYAVSGGMNKSLIGESLAPSSAAYEQGQMLPLPSSYYGSAKKIQGKLKPIMQAAVESGADVNQIPIRNAMEPFIDKYGGQGMVSPNPEMAGKLAQEMQNRADKVAFETSSPATGQGLKNNAQYFQDVRDWEANVAKRKEFLKIADDQIAAGKVDPSVKAKIEQSMPILDKPSADDPKYFLDMTELDNVPLEQQLARQSRWYKNTPGAAYRNSDAANIENTQFLQDLMGASKKEVRSTVEKAAESSPAVAKAMQNAGVSDAEGLFDLAKQQQALIEAGHKSHNPFSSVGAATKTGIKTGMMAPTALFGMAKRAAPNTVNAVLREIALRNSLLKNGRGNYITNPAEGQ